MARKRDDGDDNGERDDNANSKRGAASIQRSIAQTPFFSEPFVVVIDAFRVSLLVRLPIIHIRLSARRRRRARARARKRASKRKLLITATQASKTGCVTHRVAAVATVVVVVVSPASEEAQHRRALGAYAHRADGNERYLRRRRLTPQSSIHHLRARAPRQEPFFISIISIFFLPLSSLSPGALRENTSTRFARERRVSKPSAKTASGSSRARAYFALQHFSSRLLLF